MFSASAGRERMFCTYDTLRAYLPQAVEVLVDCIRNPVFLRSQVHKLSAAQEELHELENNPDEFLQESLHLVGYSGALGNQLFPPEEALGKIDRSVIREFYFTLMGGGVSLSSGGPGIGLHSRLYLRVLNEYHSIQLFSAFSTVYDDTGLFGIHLTTAVDIAVKELTAIATPCQVTEVELNRAKNSTVSSVLHSLESKSKTTLTEDIGSQILANGFWKPSKHSLDFIDEMTLDDITWFAQKMLSSRPTMASWGDGCTLPSPLTLT